MALLLNKQDKEEIVELRKTKTMQEIASMYNTSDTTIRENLIKICHKFKVYRKRIEWTPEMDEYILTDKKSIAEKSIVLNVSTSSIKNRLRVLRNKN